MWQTCNLVNISPTFTWTRYMNKAQRSTENNTHTGSVTSFSAQDTITPLHPYIASSCLLLLMLWIWNLAARATLYACFNQVFWPDGAEQKPYTQHLHNIIWLLFFLLQLLWSNNIIHLDSCFCPCDECKSDENVSFGLPSPEGEIFGSWAAKCFTMFMSQCISGWGRIQTVLTP